MLKEDLAIKQLDEPPLGNWCDSGHKAPEFFKKDGPDSEPVPMRFFVVKNKNIHQTVCEACLIVANHMAKLKKQGKL